MKTPRSLKRPCHGTKQDLLVSLAIQEMALERMNPRPRGRKLDVNQDEHARYVIAQKMAREEFKSLSLDADWAKAP